MIKLKIKGAEKEVGTGEGLCNFCGEHKYVFAGDVVKVTSSVFCIDFADLDYERVGVFDVTKHYKPNPFFGKSYFKMGKDEVDFRYVAQKGVSPSGVERESHFYPFICKDCVIQLSKLNIE